MKIVSQPHEQNEIVNSSRERLLHPEVEVLEQVLQEEIGDVLDSNVVEEQNRENECNLACKHQRKGAECQPDLDFVFEQVHLDPR